MNSDDVAQLVRLRIEQAEGVLRDAKFLMDRGGTSESIVDRTYFAMFYAVLAALQGIGHGPRKHRVAIGLFHTEFVLKGVFTKEMSADLHSVFDLWQEAEYNMAKPAAMENAEVPYDKAALFVQAMKDHLLPAMAGVE